MKSSLLTTMSFLLFLSMSGISAAQQTPVTILDFVLDHEEELALSPTQVEALERLDADLARELIRRQAELAVAYVNLGVLMDGNPTRTVDVASTEGRVRDLERGRAELQLVLVRGTEAVKAQLTAEQRAKLARLLEAAPGAAADPADPAVVPAAARSAAPSRGGHPGGHTPAPPRHQPAHHDRFHPHVWIGPPLWWDPFWAYPAPPPAAVEPPAYVQQSPAYWYYCSSLRAYYPSVTTCPEAWVPVPAQ